MLDFNTFNNYRESEEFKKYLNDFPIEYQEQISILCHLYYNYGCKETLIKVRSYYEELINESYVNRQKENKSQSFFS